MRATLLGCFKSSEVAKLCCESFNGLAFAYCSPEPRLDARAQCLASASNRRLQQKLQIVRQENTISGGLDVCGSPARVAPANRWQVVAGNDRFEVVVSVVVVSTCADEKAHAPDGDLGPKAAALGMGYWQARRSYSSEDQEIATSSMRRGRNPSGTKRVAFEEGNLVSDRQGLAFNEGVPQQLG